MPSIAQMKASSSVYRGDMESLVFLLPLVPSTPGNVLYQPNPEKYPYPSLTCLCNTIGLIYVVNFVFLPYWVVLMSLPALIPFVHLSKESILFLPSIKVFRGSFSKSLKILSLREFQIYHNIQAKWWASICGDNNRNK